MTLSNIIVEFYERLSTWEDREVEGSGLSLPHMHTVEILGIFGDMRMKELASRIGVTTGTLTITVDKLEKKGLLRRIPNPDDRRSYLITLTEEGLITHKKHTMSHEKMTRYCLESFTAEESITLSNLLGKFIKGIPSTK